MSTAEIIGIVFGGIGTAIGTISLIWNILRDRRKVIVTVQYAFMSSGIESLSLKIINKGHRRINVEEVGFALSDRSHIIDIDMNHNLGWIEDGDSKSCYFSRETIDSMKEKAKARGVKIIGSYIRDSSDVYYLGKIHDGSAWFEN